MSLCEQELNWAETEMLQLHSQTLYLWCARCERSLSCMVVLTGDLNCLQMQQQTQAGLQSSCEVMGLLPLHKCGGALALQSPYSACVR